MQEKEKRNLVHNPSFNIMSKVFFILQSDLNTMEHIMGIRNCQESDRICLKN